MSSLPVDVLVAIERVFRQLRVDWYIFGAQAAAMHGAARLTIDVDVTVALRETSIHALTEALVVHGFAMRVADDDFVQRTRVLSAVHSASGIPVDIVLAGPGIEELFLARVELRDIRGTKIPVACAEDIAVMKVLAGRAKDIDDVVAIMRARGANFRRPLARATLDLLELALDRRDLVPVFEQASRDARSRGPGKKRTRAKTAGKVPRKRSVSPARPGRPKKAR